MIFTTGPFLSTINELLQMATIIYNLHITIPISVMKTLTWEHFADDILKYI